jgi:hypothetical protein
MQYLHFGAQKKIRMWGLSIFIRISYPKCNTCILGHTKNTHVGVKPSLNEDPTLNVIPTFWVTLK